MALGLFLPREEPEGRPGGPLRGKRAKGAPLICFQVPWSSMPILAFLLAPGSLALLQTSIRKAYSLASFGSPAMAPQAPSPGLRAQALKGLIRLLRVLVSVLWLCHHEPRGLVRLGWVEAVRDSASLVCLAAPSCSVIYVGNLAKWKSYFRSRCLMISVSVAIWARGCLDHLLPPTLGFAFPACDQ